MSNENGLQEMPDEYIGSFRNGGCTDYCDMLSGPCACGAWHHWEDWPEEVQKRGKELMYGRYMQARREYI